MLPVAASVDDVGMTRTGKQTPTTIVEDFYTLDYARLTHGIHVDTDDRCPLCIANELRTRADARIVDLRGVDVETAPDGGRLTGQMMTAAYARRDLAEYLEDGTATLTCVERSAAWGLGLRYRVNDR